jgi:hypothetical protein
MRLHPYVIVDTTPFSATRGDIERARGPAPKVLRNGVGLTELDYGSVVFRFQDNGRLEEVTRQAPVVYFGNVDVPFNALDRFVRDNDDSFFERAGFIVSPIYGLAFDPQSDRWVTALAAHCIDTWHSL